MVRLTDIERMSQAMRNIDEVLEYYDSHTPELSEPGFNKLIGMLTVSGYYVGIYKVT